MRAFEQADKPLNASVTLSALSAIGGIQQGALIERQVRFNDVMHVLRLCFLLMDR
jgi:hypothetical protein